MFILAHAKDIWYIVLSLCALTITGFAAAFLYYLVLAAKDVRGAAEGVKRQVDALEDIINSFRTKVSAFVSYAALAGQVAKKVTDFLRKESKTGRSKAEPAAKKGGKRRPKHDESMDFMAEEL